MSVSHKPLTEYVPRTGQRGAFVVLSGNGRAKSNHTEAGGFYTDFSLTTFGMGRLNQFAMIKYYNRALQRRDNSLCVYLMKTK